MNYEIDHQKLSEQIFAIVKTVAVPAGLYIFLTFILVFGFYFIGFIALFNDFESLLKITSPEEIEAFITTNTTQVLVLNTIVTIFAHFLLSGVYGLIKKGTHSPMVGLGDGFKIILSKKGLKVLNVVIITQLVSGLISYGCSIAGFALVGFALGILIQFLTYFIIPAIYVNNSGIIKGLQTSVAIVNLKPGVMFAFIFMTYLMSLLGILLFGIGIIFTLPLNYIVAYSLYTHIYPQIKN